MSCGTAQPHWQSHHVPHSQSSAQIDVHSFILAKEMEPGQKTPGTGNVNPASAHICDQQLAGIQNKTHIHHAPYSGDLQRYTPTVHKTLKSGFGTICKAKARTGGLSAIQHTKRRNATLGLISSLALITAHTYVFPLQKSIKPFPVDPSPQLHQQRGRGWGDSSVLDANSPPPPLIVGRRPPGGAMRQQKLGSQTPPCHRRMVITTLFIVLLAALQCRPVLYHTRWLLTVHRHWSSGGGGGRAGRGGGCMCRCSVT